MFSGIGKTRGASSRCAVDEGILCVNVESEPELELLSSDRGRQGPQRSRLGARQSRRRCQDPRARSRPASPRTSSAFRSAARARSMRMRRKLPGLRSPASTCISAARSPILQPFDDAFALLSDFVRDAARRRPRHRARRSRRRARHSLSRRQRAAAASGRLCGDRQARHADLGCTLIFEPGRLIVGNAGILVTRVLYREARRGQDLRHRRCGDERPDPPDALRGASRDHAGARKPTAGARRIVADVVGPICEIRRFSGARPRRWPSRSRAISWP